MHELLLPGIMSRSRGFLIHSTVGVPLITGKSGIILNDSFISGAMMHYLLISIRSIILVSRHEIGKMFPFSVDVMVRL